MNSFMQINKKFSMIAFVLLFTIALFGFTTKTAEANQDPAGCTGAGFTMFMDVFESDGSTPATTATPGAILKYQTTLAWAGGANCNVSDGTLNITTPDGVITNVTPGGGIPLISSGSPFISTQVSYTVDSGDVVGGLVTGSSNWNGGISHRANHQIVSGNSNISTPFSKLSPTIATVPTPASGVVGVVLNDTATLSGGSSPTGNVTFNLFAPGDTTCATSVYSYVDGTASYATTPGYTSLVAGTYRWTASYAGDANNNPATSGCEEEQVTVTKASPTITTVPSAGGPIGTVLNDTATLSGGSSPTGNVTFNLFAPGDTTCSSSIYNYVDGADPYATTPGYTSLVAGIYRWTADYAGDVNNNPASSGCQDEQVTVSKASPTITTVPSAGGPIGTILNDTATLSGGNSPTGNVTFKLFAPSDATCSGAGIFTEVDGTAPYATTPGYTSLVAGIYRWTADYAGDANNNPTSSGCQAEQVTITQPLQIVKTANATYDQKWNWTIDKHADQTNLNLADGELFTVNYDVTINSSSVVQNATVSGTITITNPAGNPTANITNVTDNLSVGGSATVVCPGGLSQQLPAGTSLVCTYNKNLGSANTDQTNTATVTSTGVTGASTSPVSVDFTTPANVIDECINVSDTNGTLGGLPAIVCAGVDTLPKTFIYSLTFGKNTTPVANVPLVCGPNTHLNTASFITNDTAATGSDNWTVNAPINCFVGCTLTQGYWKTHNDSFKGGAPTDDNWNNITPLAQLSGFFTTVASYPVVGPNTPPLTWFSVFNTPPKGNAYYNLAHQYMAAKLNILNGASAPANVTTAIASAQGLFTTWTPTQVAAFKGSNTTRAQFISLAGILGSYNEGTIGPGHCSEQNPS